MSRFCQSCGHEAEVDAKFCQSCGEQLYTGKIFDNEKHEINNLIPENIRLSLKKYEKHLSRTCLECGYAGLMGVSKVLENKKNNWIMWVVAAFMAIFGSLLGFTFITALVVGGITGIFIFLKDQQETKTYVVCPNCSTEGI